MVPVLSALQAAAVVVRVVAVLLPSVSKLQAGNRTHGVVHQEVNSVPSVQLDVAADRDAVRLDFVERRPRLPLHHHPHLFRFQCLCPW